ncbi:MAG: lipid A biosynthesis acyltransferase [Gammaproteobacteria bacterium]|nr:lipid A biosynthesis acyltransferase [Gammaproteobacteria bacterium]
MSKASNRFTPRFQWQFLRPRYWAVWLGILLLWVLGLMPWQLREWLAYKLGNRLAAREGNRQRIARINLSMAFADKSVEEREQMLRELYRTLVQSMLDYGILWWGSERRLRRLIRVEGGEYLAQAVASGKPVILLTAHSIVLDYGAMAFTLDYPGVGLIKPAKNPLLDWLMSRGRLRFNSTLYERKSGLRPVIKAIKQGSLFYYLPDEDLSHVQGSDWVFAPFFGVQAVTITSLGKLARMTGAQVLPVMTSYVGKGQYEFRLQPALENFPCGDVQKDAERQSAVLEQMIRQHPEQYMWTLTVFRTRPDGAPSPYL